MMKVASTPQLCVLHCPPHHTAGFPVHYSSSWDTEGPRPCSLLSHQLLFTVKVNIVPYVLLGFSLSTAFTVPQRKTELGLGRQTA